MSGLTNAGLANGFMQGFSMMDNYHTNKQRREQSNEIFQHQKQEWDREEAARITQAMFTAAESGNIDPELAKQFEAKTGYINWTDYIDPEFGNSLATMKEVLSGNGDINTPEGIAAVNRLYDKEIKRGVGEKVGNKTIVDKKVNRVIPTKDGKGFMLNLAVKEEDESGWSVRNAPVTGPNRSATDEEVKQIDLEQALSDLKGKMMVYEAIQKSPKLMDLIRQRAARVGAQLPQAKEQYGDIEQHPELGQIQRGPNGEVKVLKGLDVKEPGYGDPFKHSELGWVQEAGDGKYVQLDEPNSGGKPIVTAGGLVLSPDGKKVIGDHRKDSSKGGKGGSGLDATAATHIQQTAKSFHGKFNPDGSFMGMPEGANAKYTLAMDRSEELVALGVPLFKATNIANLSVADKLTVQKAKMIASREALEQDFGWGEKDKWIETRAKELIEEQGTALREYESIVGKQAGLNVPDSPQQAEQTEPAQDDNIREGKVDRSGARKAPQAAIDMLMKNPELKDQFLAKYKYLPEGF